jgi:tetratricopeptide (TPR) repeat protein
MVQLTVSDILTILSILVGAMVVLLSIGLGWVHKLSNEIANLKGQFAIFGKYNAYMKDVIKIENLQAEKMSKDDITQLLDVLHSFNIPAVSISPKEKTILNREEKYIVNAIGSKIDAADAYFNELLGSPETYLKLGNVAYFGGNHRDAIKYYDKAIQKNPNYVDAWSNKGAALGKLGKYDEALKCFDKALEIDHQNALALNGKCAVLLSLGEYKSALEYCDKTLEVTPVLAEAWANKGGVLYKLCEYDEALKYFDKALELNPELEQVWLGRGSALGDLDRDEEAFECFDEVLKINFDNSCAWYGKACVKAKKGM